jgi:LCP family protein required for cell wall assembly
MLRRALFAFAVVALVTALVPEIGRREGAAADPIVAGRVHRFYQPKSGKLFVLVIGNDARRGNPDRSRADAIHIVGLNANTMRGGILNFPRDSWVNIPGHGSGKLNQALYDGGPRLLARTLEQLTGIRLDYWVMTGFQGFHGLVRGLHGVKFFVRRKIYDPRGSGANLKAGEKHLNAWEALAYVRTRHSFPRGDIDRSTNQGRFLLALLRKLRGDVRRNPASLLRWVSLGRRHTRLDISPVETFRLAVLATRVKPGEVGNVTVPVTVGSVGSASVVFISPRARAIYTRFRKTARL